MGERLKFSSAAHAEPGPVITISRECGCPGNDIAEMLKELLNQKMVNDGHVPLWKWVNKEILQKASQELKMSPGDVESYVKTKEAGMLHDLVASFTEPYHVRNASIKKVVYEVIRHLAEVGHVIVVGRGGGTIAWNIPRSLHIYLEAPLSWKAEVVSSQRHIPAAEARKFVLDRDLQRQKFREAYRVKGSDEIYYHERFNCMSLSKEEICRLVLRAAEMKKLI